jgi:hypothetical protein
VAIRFAEKQEAGFTDSVNYRGKEVEKWVRQIRQEKTEQNVPR